MIITAAHCVGGDPQDSMVLAGVHNLDHLSTKSTWEKNSEVHKRIQVRGVKHYYVHQNYNKITDENDIAVIELDEDLDFTDYVQPACLPTTVNIHANFSSPSSMTQLLNKWKLNFGQRNFDRFSSWFVLLKLRRCKNYQF